MPVFSSFQFYTFAVTSLIFESGIKIRRRNNSYGLFTFTEKDSDTDSGNCTCRTFHIAQARTPIPTPYFCIGQESESECVSGNVNEPLQTQLLDVEY